MTHCSLALLSVRVVNSNSEEKICRVKRGALFVEEWNVSESLPNVLDRKVAVGEFVVFRPLVLVVDDDLQHRQFRKIEFENALLVPSRT